MIIFSHGYAYQWFDLEVKGWNFSLLQTLISWSLGRSHFSFQFIPAFSVPYHPPFFHQSFCSLIANLKDSFYFFHSYFMPYQWLLNLETINLPSISNPLPSAIFFFSLLQASFFLILPQQVFLIFLITLIFLAPPASRVTIFFFSLVTLATNRTHHQQLYHGNHHFYDEDRIEDNHEACYTRGEI